MRKAGASGSGPASPKDATLSFASMESPPVETPASSSSDISGRHQALYRVARKEVARALDAAGTGQPFDVGNLQVVASGLVEALATGDALLALTLGGDTHLDLARHMVNVAIYAIRIGRGIGYSDDDLRRLALAACLHDVGMVIVPRRMLEKVGPLSPEEVTLLRQHPEKGFRFLKTLGSEFEWVATVALQEQERADGSGYPQGLKTDQVHEFAKIVGLADMYDALTHPRPNEKPRGPFDAMKEITGIGRRLFPTHLLKGLIQGLSTFPVGSLVRLNSKEVARVVATNPAFPLRPTVDVLTGPQGDQMSSPRLVDLAQNSLLYITDSLTIDAPGGSGAA